MTKVQELFAKRVDGSKLGYINNSGVYGPEWVNIHHAEIINRISEDETKEIMVLMCVEDIKTNKRTVAYSNKVKSDEFISAYEAWENVYKRGLKEAKNTLKFKFYKNAKMFVTEMNQENEDKAWMWALRMTKEEYIEFNKKDEDDLF